MSHYLITVDFLIAQHGVAVPSSGGFYWTLATLEAGVQTIYVTMLVAATSTRQLAWKSLCILLSAYISIVRIEYVPDSEAF